MFKIGEFAALTQVPISQLRYYDEIQLFAPAYTHPDSGYRYYTAAQIPELDRIIVLKELGLSLEQIRSLVSDNITPSEIHVILSHQREQVIQTLKQEIARLRQIETRLEQLAQYGSLPAAPRVILKHVPELHYLAARAVGQQPHVFADVYAARNEIKALKANHLLAVMYSRNNGAEEYEVGYVVKAGYKGSHTLPSGLTLHASTLPAVEQMASLVYEGHWDDSHTALLELGRWLEQNRYQIAGAFRKVFLQMSDPLVDARAVVELQIPVEPATL